VPDSWADVDGTPVDFNGAQWASVIAAPSVAEFNDVMGSGVNVAATPTIFAPGDIYSQFASGLVGLCTVDTDGADYDDGMYQGVFGYFTGCGGGTTDYVVIVANDASGSHTIIVAAQLNTDLERTTVLETIVSTFQAAF
jgi:hypothetical protein